MMITSAWSGDEQNEKVIKQLLDIMEPDPLASRHTHRAQQQQQQESTVKCRWDVKGRMCTERYVCKHAYIISILSNPGETWL